MKETVPVMAIRAEISRFRAAIPAEVFGESWKTRPKAFPRSLCKCLLCYKPLINIPTRYRFSVAGNASYFAIIMLVAGSALYLEASPRMRALGPRMRVRARRGFA